MTYDSGPYEYRGGGAVETFVLVIGNHCEQFGVPEQPWLIECMLCMARIIDCRESPKWLVLDAEWSLAECIDRLIHDPLYLDELGYDGAHYRRPPVSDERELEIHAFLQEHAPEGLPTLAELKAEQRRCHTRGLSVVK
jgi:hypothetical protein